MIARSQPIAFSLAPVFVTARLALRPGGVIVDAPGVDPTDVVGRHDLRGLE